VKLNNIIYLKTIDIKYKEESYVAIKSNPVNIPASWAAKYGNYKAVNNIYRCAGCQFSNTDNMSLELKPDKGYIRMRIKAKTPDISGTVYLTIISDKLSVTGGIGRGTGEAVRILNNGNIYYSGFEFEKIK
jgi:hypothetical protein